VREKKKKKWREKWKKGRRVTLGCREVAGPARETEEWKRGEEMESERVG